ncbi:MAG: hypothetical protein LBD85_02400 [Oscillospiraceae bacterium]|jgi:protein-tyrosine phosphatase|nr:hypothetical protein [Oscillospiraceae bacterium]
MAQRSDEVKKILFVCAGNTCRSPLAAALFNLAAPKGYVAESAGMFASEGESASRGSVKAARKYGVTLTKHQARSVTGRMLEDAYQIRCLTKAYADMLCSDYPDCREKILTLSVRDISDPFGGGDKVYAKAVKEINDAVRDLIAELSDGLGGE